MTDVFIHIFDSVLYDSVLLQVITVIAILFYCQALFLRSCFSFSLSATLMEWKIVNRNNNVGTSNPADYTTFNATRSVNSFNV